MNRRRNGRALSSTSQHWWGLLCIVTSLSPWACSESAPAVTATTAPVNIFGADATVVLKDASAGSDSVAAVADTALEAAGGAADTDASATVNDQQADAADGAPAAETNALDAEIDVAPTCVPATETCNGQDDNCDGLTDEGIEDLMCGVGSCFAVTTACIDGVAQVCEPLPPQAETCNSLDDDCDGLTDNGLPALTCGTGACSATTGACVNGKPQACSPKAKGVEACNNLDDDCDGNTDEDGGICPKGGQVCVQGSCKPGCQLPGATACPATTFCNVGDEASGQCLPAGSACLITTQPSPCGAVTCGPGSLCHPQLQQCLPDASCNGVACPGGNCYGTSCPCVRPAPLCTPAALSVLNGAGFTQGLVDIDMDLQCGLWGVTAISGTDYLRRMTPDGKVLVVNSVGNLNMNEVAALQGFASVFGGNVVEAALTYGCCASCGCSSNPPKGVAWYDKVKNALPMVIPTNANLAGAGPFLDPTMALHLNTGPTGLTWGLGNQLYIGNVVDNGDLHTVDLAIGKSQLLTKLANRVYAAAPFDGTRMAVALQGKQVVQVYLLDGQSAPWAKPPAEVIALQRDPFTGTTLMSLNNAQIRNFSSKGEDLGLFATAPVPGRVTIGPDGWLYHLTPKVDSPATIVRWQLPEKL